MSVICGGICRRYKVAKLGGSRRYVIGQKRCNSCEIFMRYDGIFCPCCNGRLRSSPRGGIHKKKFLDVQSTKKRGDMIYHVKEFVLDSRLNGVHINSDMLMVKNDVTYVSCS